MIDDTERTKPIVWGAVVGIGEEFTPMELLEFPIYILHRHEIRGTAVVRTGFGSWFLCSRSF